MGFRFLDEFFPQSPHGRRK
jgi:hypothetical protein